MDLSSDAISDTKSRWQYAGYVVTYAAYIRPLYPAGASYNKTYLTLVTWNILRRLLLRPCTFSCRIKKSRQLVLDTKQSTWLVKLSLLSMKTPIRT